VLTRPPSVRLRRGRTGRAPGPSPAAGVSSAAPPPFREAGVAHTDRRRRFPEAGAGAPATAAVRPRLWPAAAPPARAPPRWPWRRLVVGGGAGGRGRGCARRGRAGRVCGSPRAVLPARGRTNERSGPGCGVAVGAERGGRGAGPCPGGGVRGGAGGRGRVVTH